MRATHKTIVIAATLVGVLAMSGLATQSLAQETHFNELSNLPFAEGRPTKETTRTLRDELLFQRATQSDADIDQRPWRRRPPRYRRDRRHFLAHPSPAAFGLDAGSRPAAVQGNILKRSRRRWREKHCINKSNKP
jgi:hypothetical protein